MSFTLYKNKVKVNQFHIWYIGPVVTRSVLVPEVLRQASFNHGLGD